MLLLRLQLIAALALCVQAFNPGSSDAPFSLSVYQKSRALETSKQLDASRFHFQILIIDNDNFHGRIAEGMLARIAEYNDALFTLFPASATIASSPKAPLDSAAPKEAVAICESLGLCPSRSEAFGTAFDLSYLDEYDLIIALDDDIQSLILRSIPPESCHEQKCRLLSEFLSPNFCGITNQTEMTDESLQNMIDPELWERAKPFYDLAKDSSSNVFSDSDWPFVEAAMLVACAGVTRFCLDTMDFQFDMAFQTLMDQFFYRADDLKYSLEEADDQLRKGSFSVTGYFSPKERKKRIEQHMEALRAKIG